MLAVIIETNPQAWAQIQDQITFKEAIQALLVFINGHIAVNNQNQVCVIASHPDSAQFLYPINKIDPRAGTTITTTVSEHLSTSTYSIAHAQSMYKQFRDVDEAVNKQLKKLFELNNNTCHDSNTNDKSSALSGAFSLALTYMNKVCAISQESRMRSRILVLSVASDLDAQYIPIMNSIFAAQSHRIPIDVCKLSGSPSFFQQACDSTNGVYMKIKHPHGLVQYLLSAYAIDPELRPHINLSTQRDVDFRATCFITKRVVDIGFVCSVCLCIMSIILPTNECPMCGTHFQKDAIKKLTVSPVVQPPKKKKKKKKVEGQ